MEPFDLTLSPVNSVENNSFDSFDNVINYETSFGPSDQSLPLSVYNVNTVAYTWTDYTYPTSTTTQTTAGGVPVGQSKRQSAHHDYEPVWCNLHEGQGSPPHRSFLVHHDDSLKVNSSKYKLDKSASVSRQQLNVLAQISSNTTAIAKSHRRHPRFVARTVTSPSTRIPVPGAMSFEQQEQVTVDISKETAGEEEDNSFETVAEALKLQWSVIGNKQLAPASADVVAQVVAQAVGKIKTGGSSSPTSFTSVSPITTPTSSLREPGSSPSTPDGNHPHLVRIIPTEISKERPKQPSPALFSPAPQKYSNAPDPSGSNPLKNSVPTTPVRQHDTIGNTNSSAFITQFPTTQTVSSAEKTDVSDTVSEASYSSEVEMAKYIDNPLAAVGLQSSYQLESEEFLKSLPPIKPINLDAYASLPLLPPKAPPKKKKMTYKPAKELISDIKASSSPSISKTHSPGSTAENSHSYGSVSISGVPSQQNRTSNIGLNGNNEASLAPGDWTAAPLVASGNPDAVPRMAAQNSDAAAHYKKQVEDILKEKAKLLGQVEVLTQESQAVLQERAELQAQLATLKARVANSADDSLDGTTPSDAAKMRKEVSDLRESRRLLEQTVLDANRMLSEKVEDIRALQDELQLAQDTGTKLQVKTQEMRDEIRSRDMNVQALKNKIAELYVEVQTSIQAKMDADTEARTARGDLASLLKAKEWYQAQLQEAHETRAKLQRELTLLQGQGISHGAVVERLKTECGRLRQQLADAQQRALREKEGLARHLEAIQADMMEREAAFQEIQRERKLYEDTFNSQVSSAEEEKNRMAGLQQATSDLENQLQRAQGEAAKRHEQLIQMETGQMDVMKRLAVAEEGLGDKEKALQEMEQKLLQVESQLQAVMSDLTKKDEELLALKEEKASTEIALKAALLEKSSVDKALDVLKADMGKVEQSFKQMKQELAARTFELEQAKVEREKVQESLDLSQHELEIKTRSIDSMTRSYDGQSAAREDLTAEKAALQREVDSLRIKAQNLEYDLNQKDQELAVKSDNLLQQSTKLAELESKLETVAESVPAEKVKIYEAEIEELRVKVRALEETEAEDSEKLEAERTVLREEIERLKTQLIDRQKMYDENLGAMDERLKQLMADRQQLETELGIARRSEELSQMEERDAFTEEIQGLSRDLGIAQQDKFALEQKLEMIQREKAQEIADLTQKLMSQTESLEMLQSQQTFFRETEEINRSLELELEKEKGKVLGLTQTTSELREHSHQLESALAERESALEELRRSVEESRQGLEQRDQALLTRVAELEAALEKEVGVHKDLRKQMGTKLMENTRLKKQCDGTGLELEQLKQDLAHSQEAAAQISAELDQLRQLQLGRGMEQEAEAQKLKEVETQLETMSAQLEESLAREPVLMGQIQNLEWQYGQVNRELEAARDKLKEIEDRAKEEAEAAKSSLQDKQLEIDNLQAELTSLRQEKMQQRSQVNELRGTLQASVQHHKLTRRLNSCEASDVGVQVDTERKVVIPPLPFDLAAVEQLLKDTRVRPLESRPLEQLSSCLSSLRAEITGLQKQMDQHTVAVNNSTQSWKTVQSEVNDLNEVMKTIANTIIAAHSTQTMTMTAAADRERTDIFNV